jgi:hypothetical protein
MKVNAGRTHSSGKSMSHASRAGEIRMTKVVEIMLKIMRRICHRLTHTLGTNTGQVETWWEPDPCSGKLMVGFRCDGCGKLESVDEVRGLK